MLVAAADPRTEMPLRMVGLEKLKAFVPTMASGMCEACLSGLVEASSTARSFANARVVGDSFDLLKPNRATICSHFERGIVALVSGERSLATARKSAASLEHMSFKQLELMDEAQVQESVELARLQQHVISVVGDVLPQLDSLMSSILGLSSISPERNPFRVELFVGALHEALLATAVRSEVRLFWMGFMGAELGRQLHGFFRELRDALVAQGAKTAKYRIIAPPSAGNARGYAGGVPGAASFSAGQDPSASRAFDQTGRFAVNQLVRGPQHVQVQGPALGKAPSLTAAHLHRFLAGGFGAGGGMAQAPAAAQPLVGGVIDLDAMFAVPLPENVVVMPTASTQPADQALLDLLVDEALAVMIDAMASDERLLPAIRKLVQRLQPSLVSMVRQDHSFFTDAAHPARMLLDGLCQRGLAYTVETDPDFLAFLRPVPAILIEIEGAPKVTAAVFQAALAQFEAVWRVHDEAKREQQALAVAALLRAERRDEYAKRTCDELLELPNAASAPQPVLDFLSGVWSRVIAAAEFEAIGPSDHALALRACATDLLWSTQSALVGKNRSRLARIVPPMLAIIKKGLETVEYEQADRESFMKALFTLHEGALRPPPTPPLDTNPAQLNDAQALAPAADAAWFNAAEKKSSGFRGDFLPTGPSADAPPDAQEEDAQATRMDDDDSPLDSLTVGVWVDLMTSDDWTRAQLTWTSPLGKLYMFTEGAGKVHSMSALSVVQLMEDGRLRLVAKRKVVERALDAVAGRALDNSAREAPPKP